MWLTEKERIILAVLGTLALAALGVLIWQHRSSPLTIEAAPVSLQQAAQWDAALASARQVDINTASAAELERLPGVGPTLAERIVEYRSAHGRFRTPEELQHVQGIGPKTYEALRDYATAE